MHLSFWSVWFGGPSDPGFDTSLSSLSHSPSSDDALEVSANHRPLSHWSHDMPPARCVRQTAPDD